MITEQKLVKQTQEFFSRYWHPDNGQPPVWSSHWDFNNSIPNNEKRGCYALFRDQKVIYIGVGISKGTGIYQDCGLGFRLKKYWKVNKAADAKTKYKPTSDWTDLTSIMTIGFEKEHFWLAAALEIYLINKLNPIRNSQHK